MGKRSLRALHWVEAKHPRDDRGRFSHKGGQKWARKVADELGARFGDIHMGAAPGREPQGKLQSSKAGGFLLNTKAASAAGRDAGMRAEGHRLVTELGGIRKERGTGGGSPEGMREALNNSSGSSLKATVAQLRTHVQQEGGWLKEERAASAGTISVGDLKKGDHAKLVGQDAYGKQISLNGYVQGVGDVNVRKGRNRTPMKAVQVAETPSGGGGWRGTVYVKPDHMAEKTTPKADVARLEGRRPGGTVQVVNPDGKGGFKVEGRITREEAARQMGLDKPVGGRKPGGVTTTTPKARERRAEELRISNDPKDNGAKIKAIQDGTLASASLYRKVAAGPSGQRSNVAMGHIRHTPDNPSGEFQISDSDGRLVGWASHTVRNGEPVFSVHSENYDGEHRLEGWAGELSTAADVLINGEHAARGRHDSERISKGSFESYAGKNMSVDQLERHGNRQELAKVNKELENPDLAPTIRASLERKRTQLEADFAEMIGASKTPTPKAPEAPQDRRMAEVTRIENARANFGKGEASKATEVGRKPGGGYQYSDYSKAHHDMGNLTVAEAGLPDKGAVHSQYQGMLRSINELKRQGPARVGSKDQYYRPMTRKLEEAAQYVHEHEGNPDTVAKLRALADIHRPHTDTAPKLVSGADIRSQRAAMASSLGVDMNDPNRWTRSLGDVRQEVISKAIRDIPQYYTHKDLMDAQQRLKDTSIHDTEAMDAAALNLHRIGDEIRAKQDDLKAVGTRFRTALEAAGGLADQEAAVKADLRRIKKENGIPGDAAIKKLPNGERQAAEAALFDIQKATRARVARENNLKQAKIGREVLAKGGMHPDNAAELEKRIKNVEGGATAEQVARDERERDLALAVWRHAKDNSGTTGEYPADHLKGLDAEEQMAVTVMARNVGLNAADELAQDLRGQKGLKAPKANTDYTGFSESQTRALRSIENDPLRHAQVRENFGQANAARAADEAKRAKELATVSAVALPEPSVSHADQEAALEALAKQVDPNRFKGGKIFNNHVMEGAYSGSIQDAYGKRVLNYDGRKGTWTTSNGGQLAPNQVHAYITEYNRHDQFDRNPNYLKSIVDKQVAPEFPAQTGGGTRGGGSVVADLRKISNGSVGSVANDLESGDVTPAEAADRLDRIGRQRGLDGRTRGQLSAAAQRLRAQSREDLGLNRPAPAGARIETTRTGNIKKPPRTPSSKPGSRTEQVLRDLHAELAKHPVSEQKIAFSDATIREVVGRLADEVAQGKISEDEARNQLDRLLGRAFNYAKSEQSGTHGALKKATDALAAAAGRRPGGKA